MSRYDINNILFPPASTEYIITHKTKALDDYSRYEIFCTEYIFIHTKKTLDHYLRFFC